MTVALPSKLKYYFENYLSIFRKNNFWKQITFEWLQYGNPILIKPNFPETLGTDSGKIIIWKSKLIKRDSNIEIGCTVIKFM